MEKYDDQWIFSIERPCSRLLTYYILSSLLLGPFFPLALLPRFFRYETLRYRFDNEGISVRWGLLFRREIHLTYSRIQDIRLSSNIVERWLRLSRIEIQTASGSAKAEMIIEGILKFNEVRDFIYSKMRGFKQGMATPLGPPSGGPSVDPRTGTPELAEVLREVAGELRAIRMALDRRS